jgi:thiol:disulfide interchange protein DsbC
MTAKSKWMCWAALFAVSTSVWADEPKKQVELPVAIAGAKSAPAGQAGALSLEEVKQRINKTLQQAKPDLAVSDVQPSPIPGLYKVSLGQGPSIYSNADGSHFLVGDLYKVSGAEVVNISDEERNGMRATVMATVKKDDMIIFAPKEKPKASIYVFTDVDCGYCQLMHQKVPELNAMGIEVRYLAYPRAGLNSASFNKVASAWCAADKKTALTKLKNREEIPTNVCPSNPVARQFELGQQVGLSGTPTLILENGQLIGGYVEPERLAQMLKL